MSVDDPPPDSPGEVPQRPEDAGFIPLPMRQPRFRQPKEPPADPADTDPGNNP